MRRRVLVVLALVATLLPAGALARPATAGTGSAQSCTGTSHGTPVWGGTHWNRWYVPILSSPITLGLELSVWNGGYADPQTLHAALCYSTSPAGYGGPDTTGGRIELNVLDYPRFDSAHDNSLSCEPQSNPSGLSTSCYVGANYPFYGTGGNVASTPIVACVGSCSTAHPTVWKSGDEDPYNTTVTDPRVAFSIPLTLCFGGCTSLNPSLGPTGVLHGQLPVVRDAGVPFHGTHASDVLVPPAGTTTGVGTVVPDLAYCVDGTCTPLTPPVYAGAGTNVGAGPTLEAITCFWPYCVPGGAWLDVGATVAAVQIGNTNIPVNNPTGGISKCAHFWEVVYEAIMPPGTDYPCTRRTL